MAVLQGLEGFKLLKKYQIPVVRASYVSTVSELKSKKYPLVLKAISPRIIHKTERKAVVICNSFAEASKEFRRLSKLGRVLWQDFVEGEEVILGAKRDEAFGPVVLFGMGGVFVELLKDVSFRVAPIGQKDAREMIKEIKGYPLLAGVRGARAANFKVLEDALVNLSKLAYKENVTELDINPFIINPRGGKAVDVRISF